MNTVTLKGNKIKIADGFPLVGDAARPFTLVTSDLKEVSLADYAGKKIVLNIFPSIDTGVCALQLETFSKKIDKMEEVVLMTASKDLPFAMKRFCASEGLETIINASDFRYNDFASQYNVEMTNGPLKGLFARVVLVLDKDNNITYKEEVDDITHEPNYDAAKAAVEAIG